MGAVPCVLTEDLHRTTCPVSDNTTGTVVCVWAYPNHLIYFPNHSAKTTSTELVWNNLRNGNYSTVETSNYTALKTNDFDIAKLRWHMRSWRVSHIHLHYDFDRMVAQNMTSRTVGQLVTDHVKVLEAFVKQTRTNCRRVYFHLPRAINYSDILFGNTPRTIPGRCSEHIPFKLYNYKHTMYNIMEMTTRMYDRVYDIGYHLAVS